MSLGPYRTFKVQDCEEVCEQDSTEVRDVIENQDKWCQNKKEDKILR